MVYFLGFSKVATVALSSAFDTSFNLDRITTTVIGIVIIVIQGVLTILMMILIVLGAISSYMSLSRNHEDFYPRKWADYRTRYFAHIEQKATDQPVLTPPPSMPEVPKEPYFKVASVRREPKIEDEDEENGFVLEHLFRLEQTMNITRTGLIHFDLGTVPQIFRMVHVRIAQVGVTETFTRWPMKARKDSQVLSRG